MSARSDYEDLEGSTVSPGLPGLVTVRTRTSPSCSCISARKVLAILSSVGFLLVFSLRSNLSVTMVAMVNSTDTVPAVSVNETTQCSSNHANATRMVKLEKGEFSWDEQIQSIILGSFYYGYCLMQIPGGWLAQNFGGKRLVGGAVLITSLLTLLSPVAARFQWWMLVAVRFLEGAVQGVIFPAMHSMWGRWAPKSERTKLVTFTLSGCGSGTTVGLLLSGYICKSEYIGGWPSAFYIFGGAGCLWCIVWLLMVYDLPADHPRISSEELHLLQTTTSVHVSEETSMADLRKLKPPWKSILTSPALYGIIGAHVANDFGFFTLASCLPMYMKYVLMFDIDEDGILSAVPYIIYLMMTISAGLIADLLRGRGLLSTVATRKLMNTLGMLIPAGLMLGLGYIDCNTTLAVCLLSAAVGITGLTAAGYSCNHIDIAPKFSGILMGFTNTFGTMTGFIGPYIVGVLTYHNQRSRAQWQKFFYIVSGVYGFGGTLFLLFAQGEEQMWSIKATLVEKKPINVQNVLEKSQDS